MGHCRPASTPVLDFWPSTDAQLGEPAILRIGVCEEERVRGATQDPRAQACTMTLTVQQLVERKTEGAVPCLRAWPGGYHRRGSTRCCCPCRPTRIPRSNQLLSVPAIPRHERQPESTTTPTRCCARDTALPQKQPTNPQEQPPSPSTTSNAHHEQRACGIGVPRTPCLRLFYFCRKVGAVIRPMRLRFVVVHASGIEVGCSTVSSYLRRNSYRDFVSRQARKKERLSNS